MKHIIFALLAAGFLVFLNIPDTVAQACGNFTPRLEIGMWARVTPGEPNNVRVLPIHTSEKNGQIPGAGEFVVLDGPECDNNYTWWKVDHNGLIGWTAEWGYINGEYWLEPYESARPASTIPPTSRPTNAPPPTSRATNTPVPAPAVEDQSANPVSAPSYARPKDSNVENNILQASGFSGFGLWANSIKLLGDLDKDKLGITINCRYDPERSKPTARSGKYSTYNADTFTATVILSQRWFEVLQGPSLCFHNDIELNSVEAIEISTGTSYRAESYLTTFNSGGKTRSVFLPIVAYAKGGQWRLEANDFWIIVEISRQNSNLIIVGKDEVGENDETVITGLYPYETVAIAEVRHPKKGDLKPYERKPSQVRVLQYYQADSNGNAYLPTELDLYSFIHRFRQTNDYVSYLAVFGEDGAMFTRFMSEEEEENIRRNIWAQ